MSLFLIFFLSTSLLYLFFLGMVLRGWQQTKYSDDKDKNLTLELFVSILIPARNEEKNILYCLNALLQQTYSNFEIIVIDDDSEDNTYQIADHFFKKNPKGNVISNLLCLNDNLQKISPKKTAIQTGVNEAKGELIVVLDADCIVEKNWLRTIVGFYTTHQAEMIVMPVRLHNSNNFLTHFQQMDIAGLILITCGALFWKMPVMANGGNLAYKKSSFDLLQGYQGNMEMPGGDDIMLLLKFFKAYPDKVFYLKNQKVVAITQSADSLLSFFSQRLRWASKAGQFGNLKITFFLALAFSYHIMLMALFIYLLFKFEVLFFVFFIISINAKFFLECKIVQLGSQFLGQKFSVFLFAINFFIYPIYVFIVGVGSKLFSWRWKGRVYNR